MPARYCPVALVCLLFSAQQAAQALKEAIGGGGKVNPLYRQMVVLAVRSGAAGAARYFKPSGEGTNTPAANKRVLTKVSFEAALGCPPVVET